ncbi:hypothetical protein D3C85_1681770 [compost metagenome]
MMGVGRTNKISIACANLLHEKFKVTIHTIRVCLGVEAIFSSFGSNFITMFIGTDLKTHIMPVLLLVARPNISKKIIECIANMRRAVNVRNGGRDV